MASCLGAIVNSERLPRGLHAQCRRFNIGPKAKVVVTVQRFGMHV
jgi:hypothetical protein